jgi:hypothetical protein
MPSSFRKPPDQADAFAAVSNSNAATRLRFPTSPRFIGNPDVAEIGTAAAKPASF